VSTSHNYLSDEEITQILKARAENNVELCLDRVIKWINYRVKVMVRSKQNREDIESECIIFFLSKIFPKIEQRELKPTSVYIARRMNMYIRFQATRYNEIVLEDKSAEVPREVDVQQADTTIEQVDEQVIGGPVFTRVIRMLMDGWRQADIARELHISRQRIWQLKKKMQRRKARYDAL
jgi:hypothetical protein